MHSSASLIAFACLILAATPASAQIVRGAITGAFAILQVPMDEWEKFAFWDELVWIRTPLI